MMFKTTAVIIAVAMILLSCDQKKAPTFKPYGELFEVSRNSEIRNLLDSWSKIKKPSAPYQFQLDSGWLFVQGDSTEGLVVESVQPGKTAVVLPHRLLAANRPLWYQASIALKEPGVFHIDADDGAQLFVNGKQVPRLDGEFFPADFSTQPTVNVRVLNNAMAGGLRSVQYISKEMYEKFVYDTELYLRLKHVVEQAALIVELNDRQFESVMNAVRDVNDSTVSIAEESFEDFPFITGPWIIDENNGMYRVMAWFDQEQDVTLRYGTDPYDLDSEISSSGQVVSFSILALPEQKIYYRLTCRNTVSPLFDIHLNERITNEFSFNAWADSQSGWPVFYQNLKNISKYDDSFGLGAGDLVGNGSDREEWRTFYNVLSTSAAERPYFLISGNHDYDGYYDNLSPENYRHLNSIAQPHYYSWTYGNSAFIALDPNESFPIGISKGSKQYEWFQKEIKTNSWKQAQWHFIFLHQPPYSQGWEGYSGDHFLRELLEPVIESASIDVVISGHTHDYERLLRKSGNQETLYLIVGGGGGSIEPPESSGEPKMDTVIKRHHMGHFVVSGNTLRFEAIGVDGKVMDSIIREK
jgi:Calcineurin-like phosphoesterase